MAKIDLILENIRDEYMINLLEESEVSELEALKTKRFLNESLNRIRGMLVEEGAMDSVKSHLANNWGKYLAGAGAAGAGYGLADMGDIPSHVSEYMSNPNATISDTLSSIGGRIADNASEAYKSADLATGGYLPGGFTPDQASMINTDQEITSSSYGNPIEPGIVDKATEAVKGAYDTAAKTAGELYDQAGNKIQAGVDYAGDLYDQAGNKIQAGVEAAKQFNAENPRTVAGALGATGAAGLGAAGYGAKKLADRLRK